MHHGLEHEYEVMDNDDPDEANGEVDVTVHHMSSAATWDKNTSLQNNLHHFWTAIVPLNKEVFGHIGKRKQELLARIHGVDRALQRGPSDFLCDLERRLKADLSVVLEHEECLWFQKARTKWISRGDHNIRMFCNLWPSLILRDFSRLLGLLKVFIWFRAIFHAWRIAHDCPKTTDQPIVRGGCSRLWRGICIVWEDVRANIRWQIGDGESGRFWRDSWLHGIGPLIELVLQGTHVPNIDAVVADMIDEADNWRFVELDSLVPMEGLLCIAVVMPLSRGFRIGQFGNERRMGASRSDQRMSAESVYATSLRLQQECCAGRVSELRSIVTADVRHAARATVCWQRPLEGWCKLNSDGAVLRRPSLLGLND
ncbi:hypothetical protein V6N12_024370 [Hibiscus sabdariffa]|uniref:Uncharacterized protein n=1 Tax=Hibiscus sabdariffa TaxID=183260 RepID=A0ABR2G0E1_9ROSI